MSPKTRPFLTTHRKIISCIHIVYRNHRFALWEIRIATGVSPSSIARTMKQLVRLRLVRHFPNSGQDRNYLTTSLWSQDVMKNIEVFETAKVLNI